MKKCDKCKKETEELNQSREVYYYKMQNGAWLQYGYILMCDECYRKEKEKINVRK